SNFGLYKIVEPERVSQCKNIPEHIPKPSYYLTGEPTEYMHCPEIKTDDQIEKMRVSGKLAAKILKTVGENIRVTLDLKFGIT
ncbi:hypothetical protein NQ317_014126, partial [Molorchus minor]